MKKPVIMEVDPDTILGHVLDPDNGYKVIHVGRGISPQLMDMVGDVYQSISVSNQLIDRRMTLYSVQYCEHGAIIHIEIPTLSLYIVLKKEGRNSQEKSE
jgi:hypothetical protein